MSYEKPRLGLMDTGMDIVMKFGEGNPGAIRVLMDIIILGGSIDRDDAFGGLGAIMELDNLDVYGSKIWILYKDVCKENLTNMIGLLRSVQLGINTSSMVNSYIDAVSNDPYSDNISDEKMAWTMAAVREKLPKFSKDSAR